MPAARPLTPARRDARPVAVAVRRPAPAFLTALLAALCALGLTAALAVVAAAPAHAHDRLVSSDPADGAQLDAPPAAITLTFSTEPLDVEPQVVVTDSAGTVVTEGTPTIAGPTATLPLDTAALGGDAYTVAWRVVSSDGHPIEGTFGFAVAAQPEPAASEPSGEDTATDTTADDTASGEPSADASGSASSDASTPADELTANGTASDADEGSSTLPLVIGIVVAVVVVGGVVTVLVLRRRGDGTPGTPQRPEQDPQQGPQD